MESVFALAQKQRGTHHGKMSLMKISTGKESVYVLEYVGLCLQVYDMLVLARPPTV